MLKIKIFFFLFLFGVSFLYAQARISDGIPIEGTFNRGAWHEYIFTPSVNDVHIFRSSTLPGHTIHTLVIENRVDNGAWQEVYWINCSSITVIRELSIAYEYRIRVRRNGAEITYNISVNTPRRYYATESDFSFTLASDNASVVLTRYIGPSDAGTLIIPSTIQGLPVSEIGRFAFSDSAHFGRRSDRFFANRVYNREIINVIIPEGIRVIGEGAFFANQMFTVSIPSSVTTIGNNAFYACSNLREIYLPDSVVNFGQGVFANSGMINISFPSSMSVIPHSFLAGTPIASIVVPEGIIEIGDFAFSNCRNLSSVILPSTLKNIGNSAFNGNSSLPEIIIPRGVTHIGNRAFAHCTSLISVIIPEGITTINSGTFYGSVRLQSVTLPSTIRYINAYAFANCRALIEIIIPASIDSIIWGGQYRPPLNFFDTRTDTRPFRGVVLPLALQVRLRHLGYTFNFDT